MIFNSNMIFRGQEVVSSIEKDKRFNRINIELDRFGNKSILSFDRICFNSFIKALNEFLEKGEISQRSSESCHGQASLESILLDLSGEKNFSVSFDLGDTRREICFLKMRSDHTGIFLGFSEDQLDKVMSKFQKATKVFSNLREAEKETIVRL